MDSKSRQTMATSTSSYYYKRMSRKRVKKVTTCEHLEQLKKAGGLSSFMKIHTNFISCLPEKSKDLRVKVGRCFTCRRIDGNLHICLHCVFVGCLKGNHLRAHYRETNHCIVSDLLYGTLYCFKCTDYLFDREVEALSTNTAEKSQWLTHVPTPPKHKSLALAEILVSLGIKSAPISPRSTLGLRGLVNLGHTCFMSCIIQAMIHTPLLRDFFFTERVLCTEKHDRDQQKPCIITVLYELYQKFYDGNKSAVSLHNLLHLIWNNAAHLAGYEQQDAHEFFIAILDALHQHYSKPGSKSACRCVIDVIFSGQLQSAVTCTVCGQQSITVDPFWDISLDLAQENSDPNDSIDLNDCLNRYTRVEHLGSSGIVWCSQCKNNQESTKQLKFLVLPVILCLHLKRFEHSTNYKKIDNRVKFPEQLDLAPYTCHHSSSNDRSKDKDRLLAEKSKESDNRYSLYAIVNHVGSLEGGHYYSLIRPVRDEWYKCDDHIITKVSKEDALKSPGYLLFYHKELLYYA